MKLDEDTEKGCLYCGEKNCTNIWHINIWIKKPKMFFALYGIGMVLMLIIAGIMIYFRK